jgi:undecaprenyl-diphosphatase
MVGIFLIINGFNLLLVKNKTGDKGIEDISLFSFFKIGLGQCLGLIPGFSRSGSALSMCYRENMNKEDSEKFTFLMLFPLVIGSLILNIGDFSFDKNLTILLFISFIITFMVTFFSLGLLSKVVRRNKLYYFSYYCIIIGLVVIMFG